MIPSHIVTAPIVPLPMKLADWKKAFLSGEHLDFQWSFEKRREQES